MEYGKNANDNAKKTGIVAGILVAAVYLAALIIEFGREGVWKSLDVSIPLNPALFWNTLFAVAIVTPFSVIGLGFITGEIVMNKSRRHTETLMSVLYWCENNGVTALVTPKQDEAARIEYQRQCVAAGKPVNDGMVTMYVVPEAMIFCADDHNYPGDISHMRTGNYTTMKTLTAGCRIERRNLFVPFSSFVMADAEWQTKTFRPPTLWAATQIIQAEKDAVRKAARRRRNETFAMHSFFYLGACAVASILFQTGNSPWMTWVIAPACGATAFARALIIARRRRTAALRLQQL